MVKAIGLGLLAITATLIAFTIFSLATVRGREATVCKLLADVQGEVTRSAGDKAQLAMVLPLSGTPGAVDADGPVAPMAWLTVAEGLSLPLPHGDWKLARRGTRSVMLERASAENDGKDDRFTFGPAPEAETATKELYSTLGQVAMGKTMVFGELISRAYGLDLTLPCDPRRNARALALDGLLLMIKGLAVPGRIVSGVRDQLPHATTIVRLPQDEARRLVETTFQDPANPGRWLHLSYLLTKADDATDVVRALRLATRAAASRGGTELSPDGWKEALSEAGLGAP